jgi:hypothetical protein
MDPAASKSAAAPPVSSIPSLRTQFTQCNMKKKWLFRFGALKTRSATAALLLHLFA